MKKVEFIHKMNKLGLLFAILMVVIIAANVAIYAIGYHINNREIDVSDDIKMSTGHLIEMTIVDHTQDVKGVYTYKRNVGDEIIDCIINGLREADADGDGIITVEERIQYCNG